MNSVPVETNRISPSSKHITSSSSDPCALKTLVARGTISSLLLEAERNCCVLHDGIQYTALFWERGSPLRHTRTLVPVSIMMAAALLWSVSATYPHQPDLLRPQKKRI